MDTKTSDVETHNDENENNKTEHTLREKIEHTLKVYPGISASMLQVGIGTSMPSDFWKPVLEKMIIEGVVVREEVAFATPSRAVRSYVKLSLKSHLDVQKTI